MASMAAAIAASRSAASGGSGGNRALDERERKRFSYFSSLSPMARKIMQEKERIRERAGPAWERMEPREQEQLIDRGLADPQLQARYALHRQRGGPQPAEPGDCTLLPSLRLATGQKVVHFGEEDITWQDEHSAPFSWETRSQMEFSVASLPAQEQSCAPLLPTEPRQPSTAVQGIQAPKVSHGAQPTKPSQGSKTPNMDGPVPSRKEEESAFWKISAERSKIDGQDSEFQSLTPSQIKSLEKGEKALPPSYRQESGSKDKETMRVEKPAVNKQDKQNAQSFPPVTSPSKASAAYPSVVAAAYPSAASTVSPSKASAAHPIVTSAPYPAATSTSATTATNASKATAVYTSDYSAAPLGAATAVHPNMVFAANQNVSSVTADYEKPRPNQSSVSSMDDVFLPEVAKQSFPVSKTILNDAEVAKDDSSLSDQQRFSEINSSSVVLKTGFDFLDNW